MAWQPVRLRQGMISCRHSDDRQLPIGFCFSFPCTHTAIGEAIMVKLTKKFENEGLVGQDPAKGLQRALDRQGANVGPAILVLWAPVRDISPLYRWAGKNPK